MPASVALRNASDTASVHGAVPPLIEKLIASTMPSAMAWLIAATDDTLGHRPWPVLVFV
jgi:hypothetical protein